MEIMYIGAAFAAFVLFCAGVLVWANCRPGEVSWRWLTGLALLGGATAVLVSISRMDLTIEMTLLALCMCVPCGRVLWPRGHDGVERRTSDFGMLDDRQSRGGLGVWVLAGLIGAACTSLPQPSQAQAGQVASGAPAASAASAPAARCFPGLDCPGEVIGLPQWERGAVGWHAWFFWLPAAGGPVRSDAYLCAHEAGGCMGQAEALTTAARDCKAAADRLKCALDVYARRVTWACNDVLAKEATLRGRLCAESIALRSADAAGRGIDWPPRPWIVDDATSADGTRPAYRVTGGVRGTTIVARAQAGQPCRPVVISLAAAGGKVWAAYGPTFAPDRVALCRRAAP